MFERTDEYIEKITLDALDREVILDAQIEIVRGTGKLKAYCKDTKTYVQFPTGLRRIGRRFVADVVKSSNGGSIFYRAYKGSIRERVNGESIA